MIIPDAASFSQRPDLDSVTGMASDKRRNSIANAQLRSRAYGISPTDKPNFSPAGRGVLADALGESRFLLQHATAAMETLYEQIANTHSMVVLTSAKGLVLHSLGDSDFLEKAAQVALAPGFDWSEKINGTNAIGTALREEQSIIVHGGEHFMNANKFLTCACAPIFDPFGHMLGALDLSSDQRNFQQHTMALVRMSAQMIENHMFADSFPKGVALHFHARAEFIGTLVEGIAVFSADGRFLSANRSAQYQLGLSFHALSSHTFSSLFGLPMSRLFALCRAAAAQLQTLSMYNGMTVLCRVDIKSGGQFLIPTQVQSEPVDQLLQPIPPEPAQAAQSLPRQCPNLRNLDTGDAQMAALIEKLRLVQGHDITVMILGETGTGKELLAQAIHADSARAKQAFISLNCASIPETLIESELFGYADGAFTGARKKGLVGKIEQANGGTLFLDEIGDMPAHLQARLLRVLQDRRITPLGAGRELMVDISIICATNKSLKQMIAKGDFREDLYYRLNGLVLCLPALRERTDFDLVVRKILLGLSSEGKPTRLSAEVLVLFQRYQWPGNFRQLHNLLRTAAVMAKATGVIERRHLPDDFLDDFLDDSLVDTAPPVLPDVPLIAAPGGSANADQTVDFLQAVGAGLSRTISTVSTVNATCLLDVTLAVMAQTLRLHRGNVSAAAKALGVSRNTIYRKKNQLPADLWD